MSSTNSIDLGQRVIGADHPCFVIAEIGINHNGDVSLAKEQIRLAHEAGADSVKFQNYRTEDFVSAPDLTISYVSNGKPTTEAQYDLFKRCELQPADLAELKRECDRYGIYFCSTPTSPQGVRDLVEVGAPLLKNGSDFLGNLSLIRSMGETGLPTIVSTGMSTASDIDEAVTAFQATGNAHLILLHCVSSYPTPPEEVNLARIPTLRSAFDCLVGFSDHTEGSLAAAMSVSYGAKVVEKHFTSSHDLPGPDHGFSASPEELRALIDAIRRAEQMIGSESLLPGRVERENRSQHRLSCAAATALDAGHRLRAQDITLSRPGTGFKPTLAELLIGRTLRKSVDAGHVFEAIDLE